MKSFKYSLKWDGDKVLVEAEDKHGAMTKLFFGSSYEAHLILTGWKTAIVATGADYFSTTPGFDWDQI